MCLILVAEMFNFLKLLWREHKFVIIILIFWFAYRGRLGSSAYDTADVYGFLILMGWEFLRLGIKSMKYMTHQVVTDGHHFSSNSDIFIVGDWAILRGGDAEAYGLKFPGDEASIVVPRAELRFLGGDKVAPVRTEKIMFEQLPREVRSAIVSNGYPKENIIFGVYPVDYEASHPEDIKRVFANYDDNYLETHKDEVLRGNFALMESTASGAARLVDRISGQKGFLRRIFPKKEEREEIIKRE